MDIVTAKPDDPLEQIGTHTNYGHIRKMRMCWYGLRIQIIWKLMLT